MLFHFIFDQSFTSLDWVTGSFWFVGDLVLLQSCPTRFVPGARHKGWDQIIKNGAANSPHLKLSIPDVKGCLFWSSFTIRSSDWTRVHETSAPPNVVVCNCKDAIRLLLDLETRWRSSVIDTWNCFCGTEHDPSLSERWTWSTTGSRSEERRAFKHLY